MLYKLEMSNNKSILSAMINLHSMHFRRWEFKSALYILKRFLNLNCCIDMWFDGCNASMHDFSCLKLSYGKIDHHHEY